LDDDFEIKQHGLSRKAYMSWYQLFRSLFEPEEVEQEQKPKTGTGWKPRERREERVSPLGQMSKQYRMRSPIARVISNAFYTKMPLETHPDADKRMHGLSAPNFLRGGGAIYWLDTTDLPYYDEDTNWSNEGEARLVRDFLYKLEPFPAAKVGPFGDSPLAVISPYRAQNELIKLYLEGGGSAPGFAVTDERRRQVAALVERNRNILHTVHSIQGRESDIVVASLVRTGAGGDNVNSSLGHVAQRTLINVLFSRARLLLVLIGRFDFFHRAASKFETADFWEQVCLSIPEEGKKSAEDLYVRKG
jgi:superfamily I DNA and/or RNA helicase